MHPDPVMGLRTSMLFLTSVLAGCASNGLQPSDIDDPTIPDTADVRDTSDTGVLPGLEGEWMAVTGSMEIAGGLPAADTVLELEILATDAEGTLSTLNCGATLVDPGVVLEQPPDEITLFGLWSFTVAPGTCSGLGSQLEIGIGPLLPSLWPAADELEASVKHTRGLYTPNAERSGLWIFGMAGTTEQIAGQGAPPSLEPLPDGRYHVRSAFLLAL